MEEKTNMNKYKIEFKQTFKKEVTVYADDESAAMNIVEQTFLKTDLLDDSTRDLEKIETKIIEKNNERKSLINCASQMISFSYLS